MAPNEIVLSYFRHKNTPKKLLDINGVMSEQQTPLRYSIFWQKWFTVTKIYSYKRYAMCIWKTILMDFRQVNHTFLTSFM